MNGPAVLPHIEDVPVTLRRTEAPVRRTRFAASPAPFHFQASHYHDQDEASQRQAELFYLQKQIQSQTPMVLVLEDGEQIEGCIEWYDRNCLKVRGRNRLIVYKSAIKYMYKHGEMGT